MIKFIFYIIGLGLLVSIIIGGIHLYRVSQRNAKEMAQYQDKKVDVKTLKGKTLIIFYSLSGHTKDIATRIQKMTGAELYEIKTIKKINQTPWFPLTLRKQLKNRIYPDIKDNFPDLKNYDTIFVGGPVWWYTVSTPMRSFLQKVDFSGKKVVPFSTQGSNYGTYFEDFANMAQNADIQKHASFNNMPEKYNQALNAKIAEWINEL